MQPPPYLWCLFTLVELVDDVRQQDDTNFIEILNVLRVGDMKSEHLTTLTNKVSTNFQGDFSVIGALGKKNRPFKIKAQDQLVGAKPNLGKLLLTILYQLT